MGQQMGYIDVLIILAFVGIVLFLLNHTFHWVDYASDIFGRIWSWLRSGAR